MYLASRQFKEKFGPRWEPPYLVYTSSFLLSKIALAIVTVDAGGNLFYTYIYRCLVGKTPPKKAKKQRK